MLKLIAPIMPFITEEIYQTYFKKNEKVKSIHISEWPEAKEVKDSATLDVFYNILSKVRQEKSKMQKPMNHEIRLELKEEDYRLFRRELLEEDLQNVTNAREIVCAKEMEVGFYD
jgi:valyl-tRNA synthetase